MSRRVLLAAMMVALSGSAMAQNVTTGLCQGSSKLGCLLPRIYGDQGLVVSPGQPNDPNGFNHQHHFGILSLTNFGAANDALGSELAVLPLTSSASGFTYSSDQGTGLVTRSMQSFGPILTERGETVGKGRTIFGFGYQHFRFNTLDGFDLKNFNMVFLHEAVPGNPDFTKDFITTHNSVDIGVHQFTMYGTVGVTNWLDASIAVPILRVAMSTSSTASIVRVSSQANPDDPNCPGQPGSLCPFHYFNRSDPAGSTQESFSNSGIASGIGDVTLRVKANVFKRERLGIAFLTDVRFPTGDEENFLGAGAYGIKPFAAVSYSLHKFTPHLNIGYQWNGQSVLAGDITTGRKANLPREFFYAAGTDIGLTRWFTIAADLLGERIFDRPTMVSVVPLKNLPAYSGVTQIISSSNILDGALGLKLKLGSRFLASANAIVQLNDAGLRDKFVPLFGVSYIAR